jgi:uncharacterized repeat protein (TIGR01451 family)
LVKLAIAPTVMDTSNGSVVVTLRARITDDRAGFAFGSTTFSSPSGRQSLGVAFFDTDRVSGTSLDGIYQRSVTLPRYSEQGIWTSNGFNLKDQADNLRGLTGDDLTAAALPTTFENGQSADLSITELASPEPALVSGTLTYTVGVANAGWSAASDVNVNDVLPRGARFLAANPSQGSCGHSAGLVTCSLGTLAAGDRAEVTIDVTPTSQGTVTNTAAVKSARVDPDLTNNSLSVTTKVFLLVGGAFGEHVDVNAPTGGARFEPTPSVSLPPGGGEIRERSLARRQVSPIVRVDALKVATGGGRSGKEIVVTSFASAAEANFGNGIVVVRGMSSACRADLGGARGSVAIAKLVISGRRMTVSPRRNMTIDIPGVGLLLLNEQTTDDLGVLTVNALHLKLNGGPLGRGNLTLAQSRCGVEP